MCKRGAYREHTVEDALELCASLLPLFEEAGIPVIRLGLNPTEELSSGAAAAGAYHPALGELVRSRILLRQAREHLRGVPPGAEPVLSVPSRLLSQMLGQHRSNVETLCREYGLKDLKLVASPEQTAPVIRLK